MRFVCERFGSSFILAAAILLGSTRDLAAQTVTQAGTLTATPFIGVSFGTSGNVDNSLGLGVGIGYDLTSNIGFEGEFSQALDVAGKDDNVDWSLTNISGNVLYHFDLRGPATPYATFGLGWEHSGIDVKNPDPAALYLGVEHRVRLQLRRRREVPRLGSPPRPRRSAPLPGQRFRPRPLAPVRRTDLRDHQTLTRVYEPTASATKTHEGHEEHEGNAFFFVFFVFFVSSRRCRGPV